MRVKIFKEDHAKGVIGIDRMMEKGVFKKRNLKTPICQALDFTDWITLKTVGFCTLVT